MQPLCEFQFHIGSIKSRTPTAHKSTHAIGFQFHIGSIKRSSTVRPVENWVIRFNSTLVRLKDCLS